MRCLPSLLLALAAPTSLTAQALHRVDATPSVGDFNTIQSAVDAANDGDLILVAPGNYAGFTIEGKALFVARDPEPLGGTTGAVEIQSGVSVRGTLATQEVVLDGLLVDQGGPSSALVTVDDCRGGVLLQDCELAIPCCLIADGLVVNDSDALTLVDTRIDLGAGLSFFGVAGNALRARDSRVYLYGVELVSSAGETGTSVTLEDGAAGPAGLSAIGSFVLAVDSTLQGGAGGNGGSPTIFGGTECTNGGEGGPAARLSFGAALPTLTLLDSTLTPGAGGPGGTTGAGGPGGMSACVPGGIGVASVVEAGTLDVAAASARRLASPSVVPLGAPVDVELSGEPFDLAFLLVTGGAPQAVFVEDLFGPVYGGAGAARILFLGVLDANGERVVAGTNGGSGAAFAPVALQAYLFGPEQAFVASNLRRLALLD